MSNIDHPFPAILMPSTHTARTPIFHRTALCVLMAASEGLATGLLLFVIALLYHVLVLGMTVGEFSVLLYVRYALIAAVSHAALATIAQQRFLDRAASYKAGFQDGAYAWTGAVALTLLIAFLLGEVGDLSRVSLTSAYLAGIPVAITVRHLAQTMVGSRIRQGELHFDTVSVIGNRVDVLNFLINGELWRHGYKLTSTLYLEEARNADGEASREALTRFAASSLKLGTDHIVFVGTLADLDEMDSIFNELRRFALNVFYAPATRNRSLKFLDVVSIGPNNALRFLRTPMSDSAVLLKRAVDIVLSTFGLVALSPLFLLVAVAIQLDTPGPVIFRQARRGFNGETFMIWKFRSMTVMENGYAITQAREHDPRITRVGRLLRRTSIDELPQLVNVLMGQMSLVGPRPHAISHDEELSRQMARYAHRQSIKPGITGWAQVHGFRGETSDRAQVEGRVLHDIYYIENWSIFLDAWTLFLTVFSPLTRRNAR